jgi:broad specificity phosphatase PhoE
MGQLIILRHGETEWSQAHRHTGRTDLPLTPHGEDQARAVAALLRTHTVDRPGGEVQRARPLVRTVCSPAQRARRTAELAGLKPDEYDPDLWEWDYGGYEGRTTPDIQQERPDWYLWTDGVIPGDTPGETADEVGARVDRVLDRARPYLSLGDVALVAHGHILRALTARWLGLPASEGRLFALSTGTLSTLGHEHARPVITSWNVPPEPTP